MGNLFQLFDNTADGVFAVDENQLIIYWNNSAQKILGYTADDVTGQSCYLILCGCDDKGKAFCHQNCGVRIAAAAGKAITNYDLATRTKSGEMRWINVSILTVLPDDNSKPVVIHLFRDATQTKQNEQFIHQMFDTVERWKQKTITPTIAPIQQKSPVDKLTEREREVLSLLAQGSGTSAIAEALSISSATVRNHIQKILHKLNVHSRLEAVAYAFEYGLISDTQSED